jgi:hypothetical protein
LHLSRRSGDRTAAWRCSRASASLLSSIVTTWAAFSPLPLHHQTNRLPVRCRCRRRRRPPTPSSLSPVPLSSPAGLPVVLPRSIQSLAGSFHSTHRVFFSRDFPRARAGLSWSTDERSLEDAFSSFGTVTEGTNHTRSSSYCYLECSVWLLFITSRGRVSGRWCEFRQCVQ